MKLNLRLPSYFIIVFPKNVPTTTFNVTCNAFDVAVESTIEEHNLSPAEPKYSSFDKELPGELVVKSSDVQTSTFDFLEQLQTIANNLNPVH